MNCHQNCVLSAGGVFGKCSNVGPVARLYVQSPLNLQFLIQEMVWLAAGCFKLMHIQRAIGYVELALFTHLKESETRFGIG